MTSIPGLGSGLDITSLINQLMQVEQQPQQQLIDRRGALQTQLTDWTTIQSQVSSLQTAAQSLSDISSWRALTATSSNTDAVAVSAGNAAAIGSLDITVDGLAAAHSVRSTNTVASTSTAVASGSITLTKQGQSPVTINVGDGSLGSVVNAINSGGYGVTAQAVQVGTNQYRLQVNANATGQASSFALDLGAGSALGPMVVLSQASDASITIGSGPGAYSITSTSNSITNALPGVTLTLKQKTTTPVTITSQRDGSGLADKIQSVVDAANATIAQINLATAYDATKNTPSPLTGNSTALNIGVQIRDALSREIGSSTQLAANSAGISLTKDGKVTFDRGKFLTAFAANPDQVMSIFAQQATSTNPSVQFVSSGIGSATGTYSVTVTQAAKQAEEIAATPAAGTNVQVRMNGVTAGYTVGVADDANAVATGLNAAFQSAGFSAVATAENGGIAIRTSAFGSTATFDVSYDAGSTWTTRTGRDVAGTINGVTATGSGQVLTVPTSDSTIPGFAVLVAATDAQVAQSTDFGTVSYAPGVMSKLVNLTNSMTDFVSGSLTGQVNTLNDQIDQLGNQISDWDTRLQSKQDALKQQFAELDTQMGQLRALQSQMAAQLQSLG